MRETSAYLLSELTPRQEENVALIKAREEERNAASMRDLGWDSSRKHSFKEGAPYRPEPAAPLTKEQVSESAARLSNLSPGAGLRAISVRRSVEKRKKEGSLVRKEIEACREKVASSLTSSR
jgi:hypothetical protein